MVFLFSRKKQKFDADIESITGKQGSIGLLIMASGSAEDKNIPDGPPSASLLSLTAQIRSSLAAGSHHREGHHQNSES